MSELPRAGGALSVGASTENAGGRGARLFFLFLVLVECTEPHALWNAPDHRDNNARQREEKQPCGAPRAARGVSARAGGRGAGKEAGARGVAKRGE